MPGELKSVNRGAAHGKRYRGEWPGCLGGLKESIKFLRRPVPAGCREEGQITNAAAFVGEVFRAKSIF